MNIFLYCGIILLCSCNAEENRQKEVTSLTNSLTDTIPKKGNIKEDSVKPISGLLSNGLDLGTSKNIRVLSVDKEVEKVNPGDSVSIKCGNWTLSKRDIEMILTKFASITSEGRNLMYSYLPCKLKGEVQIDGQVFKYWLNAGATLVLVINNTEYYYAYSQSDYSKYFITGKEVQE